MIASDHGLNVRHHVSSLAELVLIYADTKRLDTSTMGMAHDRLEDEFVGRVIRGIRGGSVLQDAAFGENWTLAYDFRCEAWRSVVRVGSPQTEGPDQIKELQPNGAEDGNVAAFVCEPRIFMRTTCAHM